MTDTLDLLEIIGQDALLRHASTEELTEALVQAQASEALTAAVTSGDSSRLSGEFGYVRNQSTQGSLNPAHEEEPVELSPPKPAVESPACATAADMVNDA